MTDTAVNSDRIVEVIATAPSSGDASAGRGAAPPRVLHVLAVSVPHLNGYTIRSKNIVATQRRTGKAEPVVVTSPFYPGNEASVRDETIDGTCHYRIAHPIDLSSGRTAGELVCAVLYRGRKEGRRAWRVSRRLVLKLRPRSVFNRATKLLSDRQRIWLRTRVWRVLAMVRGVHEGGQSEPGTLGRVRRGVGSIVAWPFIAIGDALVWLGNLLGRGLRTVSHAMEGIEEALLLKRFERGIVRVAQEVRPDVIHAHSPYRCGVPAAKAARRLGLPFVYEVRGFWEDSGVAGGRFTTRSAKYRFWRRKENEALRLADAVVCICDEIKKDITQRGVAADDVFITPNAVDPTEFDAGDRMAGNGRPEPSKVSAVKRRLRGCVVGYVGSLRKLEGVDELVRGAAELIRRGEDVSLLVVGGGPDLAGLRTLAQDLGIAERSVFTGRVPHEMVMHYYGLIDVFAITRPDTRVTRIVTPLKPLEAMAMGRAVVMSDLPALRELGEAGETVLYYTPGNVRHFAEVCTGLVRDPLQRRRLGERARRWVLGHRTWEASLSALPAVYERVLMAARTGT